MMGTYALHYWMSNHGQPHPNSHAKIVVFEGLDIQHKHFIVIYHKKQ